MKRAVRIRGKVTATLIMLLLPIGEIAVAQDSLPPVPQITPIPADRPPVLIPQQEKAIQQLIDNKVDNSKEISDRIQQEVNNTFGWTISLLNLLITVLIAIPIITGLVALALRRSVIDQLAREIKSQLEAEQKQLNQEREQLKIQAAAELKNQLVIFRKELENSKTDFITQLQNLFLAAQQEKDRIFRELSRITPSIIQEEFVTPEIQQKIKELTGKIESLKSVNSQLLLTANDYLKQADAFYLERRHQDALESYEKAIEANPDLIEAWLGKAKTLWWLKSYDSVLIANERAIQIQDDNPWGWYGKGRALEALERYEEALPAFEKATQLSSDKPIFWRDKGYTLMKLGCYAEAIYNFDKALEIKPNSGRTCYFKARCYAIQNQTSLAIEYLEKTVKFRPEYRETLKTDSDFDSIRENEQFKQLLEE